MISSTGRYRSTCITVTFTPVAEHANGQPYPGWHAALDYCDDGVRRQRPRDRPGLHRRHTPTRYPVRDSKIRSGLSIAIDTLLADAARLDIDFPTAPSPRLYYWGDGEDPNHPAPEGWRDLLAAEADRIGWTHP